MIAKIAQNICGYLAGEDGELITATSTRLSAGVILPVYYQLHCLWDDAMFTATRPAQHFLVCANRKEADIEAIRFHRQVER